MDTSETYIKMCDCPLIQADRPEAYGSMFWCVKHNLEIGLDYGCQPACCEDPYGCRKECKWVWLPRQDQLQEMVGLDIIALCRDFRDFAFNNYADATTDDIDPVCTFTSMEQLWLAFVMKEKYNKVWDGNTWS